jgi:cytoskeletal protein CcmA (bactofilin family)
MSFRRREGGLVIMREWDQFVGGGIPEPGLSASPYRTDGASDRSDAASGATAQSWMQERIRTVVSGTIRGKLIYQEPVRIEGRISGELSSTDLVVIAEMGSFQGRINTPRLLVLGEFEGDIVDSRSVVLGARARVRANIQSESLTIQEGARLEGDVRVVRRNPDAEHD